MNTFPSITLSKKAQWVLIGILCIGLFFVAGTYWPVGPDYFYTTRPVAEAFLAGRTRLFDQNSQNIFFAPWGIFLFFPTLIFSIPFGQALLNLVSLGGIVFTCSSMLQKGKYNLAGIILAVCNLHTFDLLIRANIDGLLVLAIGLGWMGIQQKRPWLLAGSLWMLSTKPVNVLLAGAALLWAARKWSQRDIATALMPTLLSGVLSFPIFGFDWPLRYLQSMQNTPLLLYLQTSMWRSLALIGVNQGISNLISLFILAAFGVLILRVQRLTPEFFAMLLAANLTFSLYTLGSHYVLLAPAFVVLTNRTRWGLLVWLTTLLPLLRLFFGYDMARIDILYPLVMLIWLLIIVIHDSKKVADNR